MEICLKQKKKEFEIIGDSPFDQVLLYTEKLNIYQVN